MIKYPENWKDIGHEISIDEIANAIQTCIYQLNIRNLSLSGGIDSTLLLYFMKKVLGDPINCYTITFDENHPDYIYAKMASEFFNVNFYPYLGCFIFLRTATTIDLFILLLTTKPILSFLRFLLTSIYIYFLFSVSISLFLISVLRRAIILR